jgi:hypothetical protein
MAPWRGRHRRPPRGLLSETDHDFITSLLTGR